MKAALFTLVLCTLCSSIHCQGTGCHNEATLSCWSQSEAVFDEDSCAEKWDPMLRALRGAAQAEFESAISPLANATKNTYTWRLQDPVTGWRMILSRKPNFGMHAIAYQNEADPSLVMVAVRGTQITGSEVERDNDLCADWWLMGSFQEPSYCSRFSTDQMNYYAQLLQFIDEVDEKTRPLHTCKLYTGHSLGAILSALVSAHSNASDPAVTFGPPGACYAAERLGLDVKHGFESHLAFYHEYDPVTRLPESWTNQTGSLCALLVPTEPASCRQCYADPTPFLNLTTPCGKCFLEAHIYANYLKVIFSEHAPRNCSDFSCDPSPAAASTSGAWSMIMTKSKHWPRTPNSLYTYLYLSVTLSMLIVVVRCRAVV